MPTIAQARYAAFRAALHAVPPNGGRGDILAAAEAFADRMVAERADGCRELWIQLFLVEARYGE